MDLIYVLTDRKEPKAWIFWSCVLFALGGISFWTFGFPWAESIFAPIVIGGGGALWANTKK